MAVNKKLGKGLSSLLGNRNLVKNSSSDNKGLLLIPIEKIFRDETQPRKEFNKEKIVWLAISDKPAFALDNNNMHVTAPAYIMTSHCNKYLLALLNSKTMEWYLDKVSSSTGQGTNQWSKLFVEQLPIPQINDYRSLLLEQLVSLTNYIKETDTTPINDTIKNEQIAQFVEEVIDGCVFELYFKKHMLEKGINIVHLVQEEITNIFG